jgi:hypothetical protein
MLLQGSLYWQQSVLLFQLVLPVLHLQFQLVQRWVSIGSI